jgi:hypothetical protein
MSADIEDLEDEYADAKNGALLIIAEYWEQVNFVEVLEGLCTKTLTEQESDQLITMLRATDLVRHELVAWAKEENLP